MMFILCAITHSFHPSDGKAQKSSVSQRRYAMLKSQHCMLGLMLGNETKKSAAQNNKKKQNEARIKEKTVLNL